MTENRFDEVDRFDDVDRFDHVDDIYERLSGDARRRHVAQNLLEVKTADDLERAREVVNDAIERGLVKARELAKRCGIKESAVSQFRNDRWKGSAGTQCTVASTLMRAIDQLLKQRAAGETSVEGFAQTRFVVAVYSLVQYAMKRRKIGAFVVGAGSGKSMVLAELRDETPGAILVTARQRRGAPKSFLQLWARALGLLETGRAEDIQDRVIDCLTGSDRLTLIDEAHKLHVATLDIIREVWDQTRTPIVLAGTPSFYQTLTSRRVGAVSSELMDQLHSRVGIYRNLTTLTNPQTGEPEKQVSPEDIRKVFNRAHVRLARDGVDFLCRLANTPASGCLRTCRDLVQVVVDLFPDQEVTTERLEAALQMKAGAGEAAFRMEQAGVTRSSSGPAKVAAG